MQSSFDFLTDDASVKLRTDANNRMAFELEAKFRQFSSGAKLPLDTYIDSNRRAFYARLTGVPEAEVTRRLEKLWNEIQPLARAHYLDDYIDRIGGYYTEDERKFLRDMGERFPRVKIGFMYFGVLNSTSRPFKALELIKNQPRVGWERINVPDEFIQSVYEHLKSGHKLAGILFAGDPQLNLIKKVYRYHDIAEVIIGDFTPHCAISKEEKLRLEMLAMRLLTASKKRGNPLAIAMDESFSIYEGFVPGYDDVREKVKDLDLLEMSAEAIRIRYACPPHERAEMDKKLVEFDEYVGARLKTPQAKAFYKVLMDKKSQYAHPFRVFRAAARNVRQPS